MGHGDGGERAECEEAGHVHFEEGRERDVSVYLWTGLIHLRCAGVLKSGKYGLHTIDTRTSDGGVVYDVHQYNTGGERSIHIRTRTCCRRAS